MSNKKTVVILGASYGGLCAASGLASTHNVVLIDKRDYFDMNFVAPRLLQEPDLAPKIMKKLVDFPWMSSVKLKQDTVESLHADKVVLSSQEAIEFDFCIIATGSTYANEYCKATKTLTLESRFDDVKKIAAQVKAANSVLVIGGGATGMEVAAESKEGGANFVTLVQSPKHLADNEKRGSYYEKRLKKLGIEVILGERATAVTPEEPGTAGPGTYTIQGQERQFDMVFKCVGFRTAHGSFIGPLGDGVKLPNGCIDVNPSFQVKGYTNIFAVGDAVDVDDDHVAYLALEHGKVVTKVIQALTKSPNAKLPKWKRSNGFRMTIATLGKKNALANIGSSTVFTYVPGGIMNFKINSTKKSIGFDK